MRVKSFTQMYPTWINLYKNGRSIVSIAAEYGCSRGPVTEAVKAAVEIRAPRKNTATDFFDQFSENPITGCLEWTGGKNNHGYGHFKFEGRIWLTHVLSYTFKNGAPPKGLDLCHTCDNPLCANVDHLVAGTRSDNIRDMLRKGRGATKLSPASVKQINILREKDNLSARALAKRFGVSDRTVRDVLAGKTWTFLD